MKKLLSLIAALLALATLLSACGGGTPATSETSAETARQTEPQTVPGETEPGETKPGETIPAETEKQTLPEETEPGETTPAESEAQTEPKETEKQTEPKETEKQTEPKESEKQTEPKESEKQTEPQGSKTIAGITFSGSVVEYDAKPHSLQVVGNVPSGVTTAYTYNGTQKSSVTEPGVYTVTATLSGAGYQTLTLSAKLVIFSLPEKLYSYHYNGIEYFQNPLDNNALYTYNGTSIQFLKKDKAKFFTEYNGTLYYVSGAKIGASIKKLSQNLISSAYDINAEYLVTDGTWLYYSVNIPLNVGNKNGIYRTKANDPTAAAELLMAGSASWLCVVGNKIWFAAGGSKGALSSIATTGGSVSTVADLGNVTQMIQHNGKLYFTLDGKTDDTICSYDPATSKLTTITHDAGQNLTIIGNDLYYVQHDLFTGVVFGLGVYKVPLSGALFSTKVVDDTVCSLSGDENALYYYRVEDKHFIRYDIKAGTTKDLMASFTPPVSTTFTGDTFIAEHGGEIFYLDPTDDGAIYKYNPQTGENYKVVSSSCDNIYFDGDYMYYSTHILTNYAMWRVNLTDGSNPVKISSDRCVKLLFEGDKIYYIQIGATSRYLCSMNKDGSDMTRIYEDKSLYFKSFVKSGNTFWFCTDPSIGYKKLYSFTVGDKKGEEIAEGEQVISANGALYFYDQKAKCIKAYNNGSPAKITDAEVVEWLADGNVIWFVGTYNKKDGLHRLDLSAKTVSTVYEGNASALAKTSKGIAFMKLGVSYSAGPAYPSITGNDAALYVTSGSTPTKLK